MAKVITIPIGPIYTGGGCRGIVHVIRQGDTLYKLGKKYHVSVSSIMYANPYVNIYNLQIGDELCIPVAAPVPPAVPVPLPAPAPPGTPMPLPAPASPASSMPLPASAAPAEQENPAQNRQEEEEF